jgi:hypothetical protein
MIDKQSFDGVYLVGSMQGNSADDVYALAGSKVGKWLTSLGDGEIGPGRRWVFREFPAYRGVEQLEVVHPADQLLPNVHIKPGADLDGVELNDTTYAELAAESYEVFKQRKADGTLPKDLKFLVSIPTTPTAMRLMVALDSHAGLAPLRDAQIRKDLERLYDVIPVDDLAICWDAIEPPAWRDGNVDAGGEHIPGSTVSREELLAGLLAPLDWIPEEVEVGYHLCYGDQNCRRDKTVNSVVGEGMDLEREVAGDDRLLDERVPGYLPVLAELGNAIFEQAPRSVQWLHMPTVHALEGISAEDYAPLAQLRVPDGARIYLGIVDLDGGMDDTRRHIEAAATALDRFGISSECGLGRVSEEEFNLSIDILRQAAEEIESGSLAPVATEARKQDAQHRFDQHHAHRKPAAPRRSHPDGVGSRRGQRDRRAEVPGPDHRCRRRDRRASARGRSGHRQRRRGQQVRVQYLPLRALLGVRGAGRGR